MPLSIIVNSVRCIASLKPVDCIRKHTTLYKKLTHAWMCRLGAAKALAKMADKLAGERDLVSAYLLEALLQALYALQLAEHDPRGTGARAQLADAIKVRADHPLSQRASWLRPSFGGF